MRNNKGFSLVELIIVIAIMAILVGVMAPQLIKYIEKTNVSSDTQVCDTLKSAITTSMMDPTVLNDSDAAASINTLSDSAWHGLDDIPTDDLFGYSVAETLGVEVDAIGDINDKLKSWNGSTSGAGQVEFAIVSANSVHVRIENSDSRGLKGEDDAAGTAYNADEDLIYVD